MKKIFLLILLITPMHLFALPESLKEYRLGNPTWKKEMSSKSFIATRCAVVNIIAKTRVQASPDAEMVKIGEQFDMFSTIFDKYSNLIYTTIGGNQEAYTNRALYWADLYSKEAVSNINTYNNMNHGDLGDDLMFCNKEFLNFVQSDIKQLSQ